MSPKDTDTPREPGPKDIERARLHAELHAAGFVLEQQHGVFQVRQLGTRKLFVEGLDLARVIAAFRAHRPMARRAA